MREQGNDAAMDDTRRPMAGSQQRVQEVHLWRPRRERFGELVQWDTSEHDWLESRGELRYLVTMIDDAFATDTDQTRSAGTRHRLDCRAFSSSQGLDFTLHLVGVEQYQFFRSQV
jgi:hypothetical protein